MFLEQVSRKREREIRTTDASSLSEPQTLEKIGVTCTCEPHFLCRGTGQPRPIGFHSPFFSSCFLSPWERETSHVRRKWNAPRWRRSGKQESSWVSLTNGDRRSQRREEHDDKTSTVASTSKLRSPCVHQNVRTHGRIGFFCIGTRFVQSNPEAIFLAIPSFLDSWTLPF